MKKCILEGIRRTICCIIFDKSTGHSCLPWDALRGGYNSLETTPGGVNNPKIRFQVYMDKNSFEVRQFYHFSAGDILRNNIKMGTNTGANMIIIDIILPDGKVRKKMLYYHCYGL